MNNNNECEVKAIMDEMFGNDPLALMDFTIFCAEVQRFVNAGWPEKYALSFVMSTYKPYEWLNDIEVIPEEEF